MLEVISNQCVTIRPSAIVRTLSDVAVVKINNLSVRRSVVSVFPVSDFRLQTFWVLLKSQIYIFIVIS